MKGNRHSVNSCALLSAPQPKCNNGAQQSCELLPFILIRYYLHTLEFIIPKSTYQDSQSIARLVRIIPKDKKQYCSDFCSTTGIHCKINPVFQVFSQSHFQDDAHKPNCLRATEHYSARQGSAVSERREEQKLSKVLPAFCLLTDNLSIQT